ncbi:MAG: YdcF family protein [Cyanobacteria bacterium P01_C01_bin.72]
MPRRQIKLWGLVSRKPRWGLTIRGWLGFLLAIALLLGLALFRLEPFFAHTAPIKAEVLIVEGWIGDDALKGAICEFESKPYKLIITAGSDFGRGEALTEFKNFANLAKASLIAFGFAPEKIQPIRTPPVQRDRTLNSAKAVKQWLQENIQTTGVNIYSENVHARRSWLIYRKVFEPEIKVGVIAHPALSYDPQRWWASSDGFKRVITECISYLYTVFL